LTDIEMSPPESDSFAAERARLVEEVIEEFRRTGKQTGRAEPAPRVVAALARVPRHRFVPAEMVISAYINRPLGIGHGQTISQPFIVALMSDILDLQGAEKVLEIGTGSGYQAAILGMLGGQVISVERHPFLAERAIVVLKELGFRNIDVVIGDGSRGWPAAAPYDAVIVTAGAPAVPDHLVSQLAPEGRLVIPVGDAKQQMLMRITNRAGHIQREEIMPCVFVPLIGAYGWSAPD
jgi:protein-L-isoaspartate(D-aspartate) O-methyltransferase